MENINLKLRQNELGLNSQDDLGDDGNGHKEVFEQKPDKKQVEDMWTTLDFIDKEIKTLKDRTSLGLLRHKNELWRKLDGHYTAYRQELMTDSLKKK